MAYRQLTKRQTEVLQLISEGHTHKQISYELNLNLITVKRNMSDIFARIGAKNGCHAVSIGYQHGLIKCSPSEFDLSYIMVI